MNSMEEFKKYQKEIFAFIEELHDYSNDKPYAEHLCEKIDELLAEIKNIDINDMCEEDVEEISSFLDFVNDILKQYKNEDLEPNA